jgi:hypothetical protein
MIGDEIPAMVAGFGQHWQDSSNIYQNLAQFGIA